MKEKLTKLSLKIFTVGSTLMLICGAIIAIAYVVAFVLGPPFSMVIVAAVTNGIFPVLFVLNITFCVSGLFHVYFIKDRGFRFDIGKNDE